MGKSRNDARKAHRNPIKVAMDMRYGRQNTTHKAGERRPKDKRARERAYQMDD